MANIDLGKMVGSLDVSPKLDAFSAVKINITSDESIHSASTSGRTLEFTNPWATQAIADDVSAKINGYRYQPLTANQAMLDPAAELGDGVTVNGTSSGLFSQEEKFERRHLSTLQAPADEEIDHEYPYQSKVERSTKRQEDKIKQQEMLEADTRARLGAAGISTDGPPESVEILATKKETDELGNEVAQYDSRITLLGDSITAEVTKRAAGDATLATRIKQTSDSITLEVERATGVEGEIKRSYIQLKEDVATIDASLTNITGALSVGDRVNINKSLRVDGSAIFTGNVTLANDSNISAAEGKFSSLQVGGSTVSKTTLSVVTEFTQALGETAPTTEMTILTTYASSVTPWTVPAGTTITFSIE